MSLKRKSKNCKSGFRFCRDKKETSKRGEDLPQSEDLEDLGRQLKEFHEEEKSKDPYPGKLVPRPYLNDEKICADESYCSSAGLGEHPSGFNKA